MTNPKYQGADGQTWYLLPTVSDAGGQWTLADERFLLSGDPYPGLSVTSSVNTNTCSETAIFTDDGTTNTLGYFASLWTNINSNCSIPFTAPHFTIAASPTSLCVFPGDLDAFEAKLTSLNGFSGSVTISGSFAPSSNYVSWYFGQTSSTNAFSVSLSSGATMLVTGVDISALANDYAQGSYTMTVYASTGPLFSTVAVPITVSYSSCPNPNAGGGGSITSGSLVMMADGSQVPVQNVNVGDQVTVYNVPTGYQTIATVSQIRIVVVNATITLHTTAPLPLRVDVNPQLKLWVASPNGPIEKPVTMIQAGDQIYDYNLHSWVTVTDVTIATGGQHTVYDITTNPTDHNGHLLEIIANGYPDCTFHCKTTQP
jgi:hypothetical protein